MRAGVHGRWVLASACVEHAAAVVLGCQRNAVQPQGIEGQTLGALHPR